jgi:hypothetical protein
MPTTLSFLPCVSKSDGQYQEGRRNFDLPPNKHNRRVLRQQQQEEEMNPPNPPLADADPAVAAQMRIMQ